ncbi:MAG: Lrp/AsnC family transcriptional regulator [Chloroflexi bacterium]|nr:Lrp/AsnC family transcriptional regulator [Chloroflexota bacterium]
MNNNNRVSANNIRDKEVLKILEKDARTTPEQIATMTGMSVEEVKATIKRLERDRVIVSYKTIVNWEKLGEEMVWALIEVKVLPQRNVGFDAIAQRVYRFPQAHTVYLVSGTYDFAVLVRGKTMQEVAAFVSEKLAPLEGVQGTVTHFLLKRYKVDGEILEGEEKGKRLPVTL